VSAALVLTDHLTRLTDSLTTLKDRVREAVVGELSRIASDTLSEVIRTLLGPRSHHSPVRSIRNDREYDPWDGDEHDDGDEGEPPPTALAPPPVVRPWVGWLAAAGRLLLTCVTRRGKPWWPALVLAGAGVAALTQQPLVLAALAAAHTAFDLIGP
jgi:hypothetical protein